MKSIKKIIVPIFLFMLVTGPLIAYANMHIYQVAKNKNNDLSKVSKYIDTELCRLYYNQDEEFVKANANDINYICKEVCNKFMHTGGPKKDGKIKIYFLDDKTYRSFGNTSARARWSEFGGMFNLSQKYNGDIQQTFRHELIHAVTMYSNGDKPDKIPKWLGEGIAQNYQSDINKGNFDKNIIKRAVASNDIESCDIFNESELWKSNAPLMYGLSACFCDYLIQKYGEEKIINIFYTDGDFYDIIKQVTGKTVAELKADWLEYINEEYK